MISINYGSCTSSWKPWRWGLNLTFSMRDVDINSNLNQLTKFTSSSRSTEFKDILPWNISKMTAKNAPISMRIVTRYAMKWASCCEFDEKVYGNWDNNMIRISQWRERAIVVQLLASEERDKSKSAGLWESQSVIQTGKLTLHKVVWD